MAYIHDILQCGRSLQDVKLKAIHCVYQNSVSEKGKSASLFAAGKRNC
jgi:hypothetical protein